MEFRRYRKAAYVNFIIIAINVAVFLYLETKGSTESAQFMVVHGALYEPAVVYEKEYWRLITAVFMHFGIEHLANNMLLLFVLGDNLERALKDYVTSMPSVIASYGGAQMDSFTIYVQDNGGGSYTFYFLY